jgi:hypothetical protein
MNITGYKIIRRNKTDGNHHILWHSSMQYQYVTLYTLNYDTIQKSNVKILQKVISPVTAQFQVKHLILTPSVDSHDRMNTFYSHIVHLVPDQGS